MSTHFPDLQHLEQIRRALWAGGTVGRAAVMVGAGMSRNADPIRPGLSAMPTWWELIKAMIDRLYPPGPSTDRRRKELMEQAGATSTALRLAEEFAVAFGRPALDDLVAGSVPDADYLPGSLHQLLLELPWADVLTTNYDTLLERAAPGVLGQRYSVVRAPEEIVVAARPRIVKLHGSFPSSRPFILTEEDFRTYPRRFAPFVNLAQQVAMENVLCLLGFSGDDPNFLFWTGWVRDHFGDYSPKVYLCGLLSLTDTQRLLLHSRNVIPIDFTPLFPAELFPEPGGRHRLALEWFLRSLRNGEPYDVSRWPSPPSEVGGDFPHAPLLPRPEAKAPLKERDSPLEGAGSGSDAPDSSTPLLDVLPVWRHNRSVYPGWLIAPEKVRDRLWRKTSDWLHEFLRHRDSLALSQQLELLSELNWRLEVCLAPVWDDLAQSYEHVVRSINPFPREITDLPDATSVLRDAGGREVGCAAIRQQWLPIAFGLLRYYREDRKFDQFEEMYARIGRIQELDADCRARWCYERCLSALGEMDDRSVLQSIEQWPEKTADVFWCVRRATVLAEIGHTDKALDVVERALERVRDGLSDSREHIPSLSREGWAVWLAMALRWKGLVVDPRVQAEARQRFAQLRRFGCSPEDLTEFFDGKLEQPPPRAQPQATTRPGFEAGTYSQTFHLGSNLGDKLLIAYQYFRLAEEAAHPPIVGRGSLSLGALTKVGQWLGEHDRVRTYGLAVRLLDEKVVDGYFSRHRVAALPDHEVARLRASALRGIEQCFPDLPEVFYPQTALEMRASRRVSTAMDLLARLCVRESADQLRELWEVALKLYSERAVRAGAGLGGHLHDLFSGLIKSTPREALLDRLPQLFALPIGGEADFPISHVGDWPDPATLLSNRGLPPLGRRWNRGRAEVKARLFSLARGKGAPRVKQHALLRLLGLNDLGALSPSETRQLASLFWAPVRGRLELPFEAWGSLTPWVALRLPDPPGVAATERVKEYLLSIKPGDVHGGVVRPELPFKLMLYATERPDSGTGDGRLRRYVDWTGPDIERLLGTIQAWWSSRGREKAEAVRSVGWRRAFDGPSVAEFMNGIWEAVRYIIVPRLNRRKAVVASVMDLISQVESAGLPVGAVLPATLLLSPDSLREVVSRIRREFANPEREHFLSALRGIVFWAVNAEAGWAGGRRRLPGIPLELVREVGSAVALRGPETIALSLDCASNVLEHARGRLDRQFVRNLTIGLEYLYSETEYRAVVGTAQRYPYDEVPDIRWRAARLAKGLSDRGLEKDRSVREWLDRVAADPLPEIRRLVLEPDPFDD